MEPSKAFALKIFSALGFRAEEIEVRDSRTADIRVDDGEFAHHVEVKEKASSDSTSGQSEELLAGEVCSRTDKLSHDNRISAILRDAKDQLELTRSAEDPFNLIWLHADGIDADLKYRQAFATFYGDVIVIAPGTTKHCLYFDYSAAFSMPSVEALILSDRTQLQFCLNEFSKRGDAFRRTPLFLKFHDLGAVFDPKIVVQDGLAVACRATIPRKNDDDTARALQEQTGIRYVPIRLNRHTYSAMVRAEDQAADHMLGTP